MQVVLRRLRPYPQGGGFTKQSGERRGDGAVVKKGVFCTKLEALEEMTIFLDRVVRSFFQDAIVNKMKVYSL